MRSSFKALLALLSVAAVVAHSGPQDFPRRKTLGFGPTLPHAKYTTSPEPHMVPSTFMASSDPFEVAKAFMDNLTPKPDPHASYTIREDSYTDDRTGVTHVYIKQMVGGLEIVDGRINLNIKDGKVLSYGDSFYRGEMPTENFATPSPHAAYCESLTNEVNTRKQQFASLRASSQQVPLQAHEDLAGVDMGLLEHLHTSNCEYLERGMSMNTPRPDDPRAAALMFMVAATPSSGLADDITAKFDDYLSKVKAIPSHSLTDSGPSVILEGVPDAVSPVKAKMAYAQVPNGDKVMLKAVWKLEVEMQDNWYEAAVDAFEPSSIISVVDWASDSPFAPIPPEEPEGPATYNVFKWGINDPSEGERSIEKENVDPIASPLGWHSLPAANDPSGYSHSLGLKGDEILNYTTTAGNNVFAHENWEGRNSWLNNYRPDGGKGLNFNYTYAPEESDSTNPMKVAKDYINATITQLFYTSNMVHDLYYRYGFDEKSGNFQQHNFGRGGREGDAVIANAQDGSGFNNANFMTPPDGQNGRCRMYLWNTATPYRDGDLEAGIVIHELSHGLSTRLTGGPADSGCLGWGESGGMGEGWGDFLATTIRSNEKYSDYAMGAWASNRPNGIRNYVYSTNITVNPSTYKTLDKGGYWGVHAIGEVWAEILWVTSQLLIKKHGYSDTLFPPTPDENGNIPEGNFYRPAQVDAQGKKKPLVPIHGNTLMVQLVLDGMKLQPCSPGFFEARDAILQADEILTGGENYCELWTGFATRGLGPDANVVGKTPWGGGIRTDDYSVPSKCSKSA